MTSPDEATYDRVRLNRRNLLRLAGIARPGRGFVSTMDIRSARGRGHGPDRETVAGEHIHRLRIFRLVEPGSIVCFFPASVTWRYPRPEIAHRPVSNLEPAHPAVAWSQDAHSPAVAAFVRAAATVAAAAQPEAANTTDGSYLIVEP
jgi:hypothetical protein